MICWEGFALLMGLWLLTVVGFGFAVRAYRRARHLAMNGYRCRRAPTPRHEWYFPEVSGKWSNGYSLRDAYKRQRMIDEQERLNVPVQKENEYRLGGFAD